MRQIYFTIQCTCSFNCKIDVDENETVTLKKLQNKINSGDWLPVIDSENNYNFHGRSITDFQIINENAWGEK